MKPELPRSLPSREGVPSNLIINFLNACEKTGSEIHGIMASRHGRVIFEAYNAPYAAEIPHIMHSFTKVLTNTAFALAFADGFVKLSDPLLKFFPEYEANANEFLRACTLRDLITMRNGQARSIGGNEWRPLQTSWKAAYFQVPFDKTPGKSFLYSSGNSYILSCIVQKTEGMTCRELVQKRIGRVIGLSDFSWMQSPEGVCSGGNGVSLTVDDMLRIGLLYLNKGNWNNTQLIPSEWVDLAMGYTDPLPPEEDGIQYNFHWEHKGDLWAARGMFGQMCVLIPALDMVIAMTAADANYAAMDLIQQEIANPLMQMKQLQQPVEASSHSVGVFTDISAGVSAGASDSVVSETADRDKKDKPAVSRTSSSCVSNSSAETLFHKSEFGASDLPDPMDEVLIQKGLRMTLEGKNCSVRNHVIPESDLILMPSENPDQITKIELHFQGDHLLFVMEDFRGRHEVIAGLDHWIDSVTTMTGAYLHHQYEPDLCRISAIAYWSSPHSLMMEWRFPEMAFFDHVRLRFTDSGVQMERWVNMNSQDTSRPVLYLKK